MGRLLKLVAASTIAICAQATMLLCQDNGDLAHLAERYAPQLMHPHDEPNLPTSVEWFLQKSTLTFHNANCNQDEKSFGTPTLNLLQNASVASVCDKHIYTASGTRSSQRSRTFILNDVSDVDKRGSTNPSDWVTYYHGYKNNLGGWTIQYWSFYSFNTGKKITPPSLPFLPALPSVEVGYHGGDWEMVSVVLDSNNLPVSVTTTGHTSIDSVPWTAVLKDGDHPIMYTEKGGHEAHTAPQGGEPYIVHRTWAGSLVTGLGGSAIPAGPLQNMGTKLHPNLGFVQYSGLWGSLGVLDISSGYWGPVFNETGLRADGFLVAWCNGIADQNANENGKRECFPDDPQ